MKALVAANVKQQEEILSKKTRPDVETVFVKHISTAVFRKADYDAVFLLDEDYTGIRRDVFTGIPVFINSVLETLEEKNLPENYCRINAWPGFLKRPVWEVASYPNQRVAVKALFRAIGWKVILVGDEPGLVAARVLSRIINEAFWALGEEVSTPDDIDLAMKLGTNYPYGPFEWLDIIGSKNIYRLLEKLAQKDKRYFIAPLLKKKYYELRTSITP